MYFTASISILFFCTSMAMPNGNRNDKIDLNLSLGPPKIDLNLSLGPPKIDLNLSLMPSSSQQNANNEENISNIQTSQTDAQKFPPNCAQTFDTLGLHQKQTKDGVQQSRGLLTEMIAFDRTCNPLKKIVQLSLSIIGLSLSMDPSSLISSEDLFQKIKQHGVSSFGDKILSWIQKNLEDGPPNRQLFDEMAQRIQKGITLFNNQFDLNVHHQKRKKNFEDLKSILQNYYFYYLLYRNLYEISEKIENVTDERRLLNHGAYIKKQWHMHVTRGIAERKRSKTYVENDLAIKHLVNGYDNNPNRNDPNVLLHHLHALQYRLAQKGFENWN